MWRTLPDVRFSKPTGVLKRRFHILPALGEPLDSSAQLLVREYVASCERRGRARDCAGALLDGAVLNDSGKYKIAFDVAMGARWDGFTDELRQLADPAMIRVVLLGAMVAYMAMLAFPGVITQALAAAATFVLTAYLGAQTVWNLVFGWIQMVRAADAATTFSELRTAGERYGKLIGAQTARILVMVVTAAIAEGGLIARALDLPKAAQASAALAAESGGLLGLAGVGQVSGISVAESGVTIVLTPAAEAAQQVVGMAMAANGMAGNAGAEGCEEKAEWHHIATVENGKSTARGGPWTPRFQKLFKSVDMSMEDAANKVRVRGHRGPHPEEYHQIVYRRLFEVVQNCQSPAACRADFMDALAALARQTATPGTALNRLVTRGCE